MMSVKRVIVLVCLVALLAISATVFASEEGKRNTRNVLGAATAVMAIKGNTKAALVGAAATLLAQSELDKSISKRHERRAYYQGRRDGRGGRDWYVRRDRRDRDGYYVRRDRGNHNGWRKHGGQAKHGNRHRRHCD